MTDFKFTDEQELAIESLSNLGEDFYVLKGYAGTGKTTVITYWVQQMLKRPEDAPVFWRKPKIVLTAPTNKATNVLADKRADLGLPIETSTIHSLLKLKMKWKDDEQILVEDSQGEDTFGEYDYVIVDECSMINEELLAFICRAQKRAGNKVIFMGDPCQLPPINEKESRCFNVPANSELTQVVRQADGNPIVALSIYLRKLILETPHYPRDIFKYVDDENIHYWPLAKYSDKILQNFYDAQESGRDIRHVAWTNKVVDSWNDHIRDKIYGFDREDWVDGEAIVTTAPVVDPFEEGIIYSTDTLLEINGQPEMDDYEGIPVWKIPVDRHILTVVAREGWIKYGEVKQHLIKEAKADRKKWRNFYEFMETFAHVKPAHSLTVHRSQGSTFEDVYVSFENILVNPRRKESLQCLYVAVTRPAKRLFLV